jgi:hypothetical protein
VPAEFACVSMMSFSRGIEPGKRAWYQFIVVRHLEPCALCVEMGESNLIEHLNQSFDATG